MLAQDPRHRGTAIVTFDAPSLVTATVQLRVTGPQDWLDSEIGPGIVLFDTLNLKEAITDASRRVPGQRHGGAAQGKQHEEENESRSHS